jgi:hypothetical protein
MIFLIVNLWKEFFIAFMMCVIRSFSGGSYCEEGILMWFDSRYILLRMLVKINVFVESDLVCCIAKSSAQSYAYKIFGYLSNLEAMLVCEGLLNNPKPTIFL